MGEPIADAVRSIEQLFHDGNDIIIYTARATNPKSIDIVEEWLRFHKIPFDEVTAIKPKADIYLDDKAIRFTNWAEALEEIRNVE